MGAGPLPTIREVARLAGVSVATVSKALNRSGNVSEALQTRVAAAARTLGYAPHASARSLRSGATRTLGLLVADLANPYFLRLVESMERLASAGGYSVILCNSAEDPEREARHLAMLMSQRADGIFLIPTRVGWNGRPAALADLPMPTVLVDRNVDGLGLDSVTTDNLAVGRLAAEHLHQFGHRRIGVIMGSPEHEIARHRIDGFRSGLAALGTSLDQRLVASDNFTEASGHAAALRLLARPDPPTAIFATNNHLTLGLLRAIMDRGVRVPDDVSVVAVDELPWPGLLRPRMTVVVQPSQEIADAAVAVLMDRIADGRNNARAMPPLKRLLEPRLLIGGSTAHPRVEQ